MRFGNADPGNASYLTPEPLLNNIKRVSINSGTEEAFAVAIVDSNGNQITSFGGPASGIVTGTKTVTTAGTPVRITAASTPCKGVWVACDIGTGSIMVVGDSSVDAINSQQQGIVIIPGNQSTFINVNDLSLLYVDAQANGAKLSYAYLT